jgi:hypothetical protein
LNVVGGYVNGLRIEHNLSTLTEGLPTMRTLLLAATVALTALFGGCSTTQEITLAKVQYAKRITTVVQVLEADNSPEMNRHLEGALKKEGFSLKSPLPAGTRKSSEADALISYVDVWRWDLVMYLRALTVRLYDSESGDLLATGDWKDSALHGFRDARVVVDGLVTEMFAKLNAATKAPS